MNKKVHTLVFSAAIAVILAITIAVNVLASVYARALEVYLPTIGGSVNETTDDGLDLMYSPVNKELTNTNDSVSEQLVGEGIVLLKNDKENMPYETKTTRFSFFSHSSVDYLTLLTKSSTNQLKTLFEEEGFAVNSTLWDFYSTGAGKDYKRGQGSIEYGDGQNFEINEVPLSTMRSSAGVLESASNTVPVFVISRTGGEGCDLTRSMASAYAQGGEIRESTVLQQDLTKHYLEPDSVELEIIDYLNKNFKDIVILINSNNPLELGWTENYENIHEIVWCPGTGSRGITSLPKLFFGSIVPSGHLVDTFAYDAFSSPAVVNFGDFLYYPEGKYPTGDKTTDSFYYYYVAYEEGIYVGYKYYETRYEDVVLQKDNVGDYDYAQTVEYPFGYGLSYTQFEWENYNVSWADDKCTVTVDVTNTGDTYSGKDVVEVYAQLPYTEYDRENGVEKSSVQLVGFAKTKLLAPGETQKEVTVEFTQEEFKSYDANGKGTYIIENGDYYITAAKDAHAAVNNILLFKDEGLKENLVASPSEKTAGNQEFVEKYNPDNLAVNANGVDSVKYSKETKTQAAVTNQFSDATRSDIQYLTRNDWNGTFPKIYGLISNKESLYGNPSQPDGKSYQYYMTMSKADYDKARSYDSLNPNPVSDIKVTTGAQNGLALVDLRGKAYDDPLWEDLLDQLNPADYVKLIATSFHGTVAINSISKPRVGDEDATYGYTTGLGGVDFCTAIMMAQTWNSDLLYETGRHVANNGKQLIQKCAGWYAPGMNIHRTPFSGRNSEYYSEDSFLTGYMGANVIRGLATEGGYPLMKHFALNDQENHRGDRNGFNSKGEHGLITWANEQTIREIYLKPFEMAVKLSGNVEQKHYEYNGATGEFTAKTSMRPACTGIMTSFNRIGLTWAGGHYPLLTNVLKGEWGFVGYLVSDFDNGYYMDVNQMLLAGGGVKLGSSVASNYEGGKFDFNALPDNQKYFARVSVHEVLYSVVNSQAMNGLVHGVGENGGFPSYKLILIIFDGLAAVGMAILVFFMVKKILKKESPVYTAKASSRGETDISADKTE